MPYQLTQNQKDEILSILSPQDADGFFKNIEYMMETSFRPQGDKRENLLKKQVKVFQEIAKTARKLTTHLNQLDPFFLESLDSRLGAAFDNRQPNDSGARTVTLSFFSSTPLKTTYSLSVKLAAKTLEEESEFEADSLAREYGSSSVEWVLEQLYKAWEPEFPKITASISSKFVKYVSIVLEDDDLEKLSKQIQRCKWFADYRKHRDKNEKNK